LLELKENCHLGDELNNIPSNLHLDLRHAELGKAHPMYERTLLNGAVGTINGDVMPTSRESLVSSFFSGTGGSYDRVVKYFTLGLDDYWKKEIVKLVPDSGRILELACGTGILTERLAMKNPHSEIVGVDITPDYLAVFDERLRRKPWIRAHPILGNAETVALEGEFDAVVSSYLAKYVDPDLLVSNITPHLRSGGVFIAHDFILPTNPFYRAPWHTYTWAMNHIGPVLFPEWHTVFDDGLTGLVRRTLWLDAFKETLSKYDYDEIHSRRLSFESAGLVWATKT
jgi:demethylmenaquinone methyltransferase / 2-methoxy-6-polyprenyl-1,4-benzoquinol methylase